MGIPHDLWTDSLPVDVRSRSCSSGGVYGPQPPSSKKYRLGDMESRLYNLNKLGEQRLMAQWAAEVSQERHKVWHDKHLKRARFTTGQLVLKYYGRK